MEQTGVLSRRIPITKTNGLARAREYCFANLWLIPSQSMLPISDIAWTLGMKACEASVRGALIARPNIGFLAVGFLCLSGFYIGFSGDFSFRLSRIASVVHATNVIQMFFISITSIVCGIYLFNGFFQFFISQSKDKK
jgi:hypothetical protein